MATPPVPTGEGIIPLRSTAAGGVIPWAYPFYDPFYSPFYGPVFYSPQADKGEVKLQSSAGDAEVYIDSAYAGTASKLKTFWLSPGAYDLEVRAQGREPRQKRIYVLTGKTLKVNME